MLNCGFLRQLFLHNFKNLRIFSKFVPFFFLRAILKDSVAILAQAIWLTDMAGLDHLLPIANAIAHLGVLGLLVMIITFNMLLGNLHGANPSFDAATLLLAISNAFGIYTITYSILEHYYILTLHSAALSRGVNSLQRSPIRHTVRADPEGGAGYAELLGPEEFVQRCTDAFATFNDMRALARNSMWMSLICLVSAVLTLANFLEAFAGMHPAMRAAGVFIWLTVLTCTGWFLSRLAATSRHLGRMTFIFFTCSIACIADAFFEKNDWYPEVPMFKVMLCLTFLSTICVIVFQVRSFRLEFMELAGSQSDVY